MRNTITFKKLAEKTIEFIQQPENRGSYSTAVAVMDSLSGKKPVIKPQTFEQEHLD